MIGATGKLLNIKKEVNSVMEDSKITDSIVRAEDSCSIQPADDSRDSNWITVNIMD